jgi:N-acetylneuraminic acid mutarotase
MTWTGEDGYLYLFGGRRIHNGYPPFNDLWRYNPATNKWTWVAGSDIPSQHGEYGTRGVPHEDNYPGARFYSHTAKDQQGNVWLFGGIGYASAGTESGRLNDLWRMDQETGLWTWVSGTDILNHPGVYETTAESTGTLMPAARDSAAAWVDHSGNFWVFGGTTTGTETYTELNDLWKYEISQDEWHLVKHRPESLWGTYGSQLVEDPDNIPGHRTFPATWVDEHNLWMFGGGGRAAAGNGKGPLNDLWKFNLQSKNWTWMGGSDQIRSPGNFTELGVTSSEGQPPSRMDTIFWSDALGHFWIFGGVSRGVRGTLMRNDLWKFSPSQGMWTWMKGSESAPDPGHYGEVGIPAPDNSPPSRGLSAGWGMEDGTAWIFGGTYYDDTDYFPRSHPLNDMWRYTPPELQSGIDWSLTVNY